MSASSVVRRARVLVALIAAMAFMAVVAAPSASAATSTFTCTSLQRCTVDFVGSGRGTRLIVVNFPTRNFVLERVDRLPRGRVFLTGAHWNTSKQWVGRLRSTTSGRVRVHFHFAWEDES